MEREIRSLEKEPISIADGVYWIGYADKNRGLHCNPYLIIEGDEAVLIDAGNRDDFSTVMLKILRTGLQPSQIVRLVYQHYDPDLCGSLPQIESIINNKRLKIISHKENNVFIHYYSTKTQKTDYNQIGGYFEFATGRRLEFYGIPYCHVLGSFITLDTKTKTLFSSDLFGSFDIRWQLFFELEDKFRRCRVKTECSENFKESPLKGIIRFHQKIMTSNSALKYALDIIEKLDIELVAPQHGSIISGKEDIAAVVRHLRAINNVGIDCVLAEDFI